MNDDARQPHPAKARLAARIALALLVVGLLATAARAGSLERWLLHAEGLRAWLLERGAIKAAGAFLVLNTLLCASGVPRLWTGALAGAVFGAIPGLLLALPSSLAGAAMTFEFGRRASDAWLADAIPAKWKGWIDAHATPDALQTAVIRQLPVPGAVLTLLLAAGAITRRNFLVGSAIGFLPAAAIAAFVGTAATTRQTAESLALAAAAVAASLGALVLLRRGRNALAAGRNAAKT